MEKKVKSLVKISEDFFIKFFFQNWTKFYDSLKSIIKNLSPEGIDLTDKGTADKASRKKKGKSKNAIFFRGTLPF